MLSFLLNDSFCFPFWQEIVSLDAGLRVTCNRMAVVKDAETFIAQHRAREALKSIDSFRKERQGRVQLLQLWQVEGFSYVAVDDPVTILQLIMCPGQIVSAHVCWPNME